MRMDKDRIAGSAKDFAGKAEGAVGGMAGDNKAHAEGSFRETGGAAENPDCQVKAAGAQNRYGQAKEAAREAKDAAFGYAKDSYEKSSDTFRDGSQAIAKSVQE